MQDFSLQADFTDLAAEREVIAAVAKNPRLYGEIRDLISNGTFFQEDEAWRSVVSAIHNGQNPPTFEEWKPAINLKAAGKHLADLFFRRAVAKAVEEVAAQLYKCGESTDTLKTTLELSFARVQKTLKTAELGKLVWATDILVDVLEEAERRQRERENSGKPVLGLPTGIKALNEMLGGLDKSLYILAGPPGVGKTSFALQMSTMAASEAPVVYVTFENPAKNLTVKAICARAGIDTQHVRRGTADLNQLRKSAIEWALNVAPRVAFIEGMSQLSVAHLRARALDVINRHNSKKCLIVVDYLQLWAKLGMAYRGLESTRSRVEALTAELRELAMYLNSPVLAIAAQNREQGDYGDGNGRASLDSIKESGDIEYACDVAMFLVGSTNEVSEPNTRSLRLIVKKNRDGDTGSVHLTFRPDISRFCEEGRNV
jgi:replicative DNA helicase